jgi:uncharacterized protein YceK
MLIQKVMGSLALTAVLTSSGCGTMANIEGRQLPPPSPAGQEICRPFGGVRRDIAWAKASASPGNLKYVADLPLSLVGDIVTLPKAVIGTHSDNLFQGSSPGQPPSSLGPQPQPGPNP